MFSLLASAPPAAPVDGLSTLIPDVVLDASERRQLAGGEPIVKLTAARDGHLELNGVIRADISTERFLRWMTSVEALQRGKYVPEIGRFSPTPHDADLAGLTIDDEDLGDLVRCRPGDCGVKLSAEEILAIGGRRDPQHARAGLRQVLVQRAAQYIACGDLATPPYSDDDEPVNPAIAFASVMQRMRFFERDLRCYASYLRTYPARDPHVEQSFLYWSKETLGLKPIISITHLSAERFAGPWLPAAVVVAKQVYASHYKNASVTVTALVSDGNARFVVYANRTHVDAFGGRFGGIVRRLVQRRVAAEAPAVLRHLRYRLESGDPPA
jgi:hypothetical protein